MVLVDGRDELTVASGDTDNRRNDRSTCLDDLPSPFRPCHELDELHDDVEVLRIAERRDEPAAAAACAMA